MKALPIIMLIALVLVGLQMKPTYHLYGIKITLDGDLEEAARRAHLAQKLMFQTKMLNVNNLDIIQNNLRLSDGTHVYVLSQHGLDSAQIYVPPKPGIQEPRKKKWIEQYIWPAFEAWVLADPPQMKIFKGVVICKGGGFNPPYEFVSKESLPEDWYNKPAGDLPEERIWHVAPTTDNMVDRMFEDLQPAGIATPVSASASQPEYSKSGSMTFQEVMSWGWTVQNTAWLVGQPAEWTSYHARATLRYTAEFREYFLRNYGIGYYTIDEGTPDTWTPGDWYDTSRMTLETPLAPGYQPNNYLDISLPVSPTHELVASGVANFMYGQNQTAEDDGLIFTGDAVLVDTGASLPPVIAEAETKAMTTLTSLGIDQTSGIMSDSMGTHSYSLTERSTAPQSLIGSVKNAQEFGIILNFVNKGLDYSYSNVVNDFSACSQYPSEEEWICCGAGGDCTDNFSTNRHDAAYTPITIYIDAVSVGTISGDFLRTPYQTKYFDALKSKKVALFYTNAVNGSRGFVYADNDGVVFTEIDASGYIPDVTGPDGELLTHQNNFRLIRETVTYEEEE